MKKGCILLGLVILTITTHAQTVAYFGYIHKADSLMRVREFDKAAALYDKAMAQAAGKILPGDGYIACRAFTLSGQTSKAFTVLGQMAAIPFFKYTKTLLADQDLAPLHQDSRWNDILQAFKRKDSIAHQRKYDLVRIELELVLERDQHLWGEMVGARQQTYPDTADIRKTGEYIAAADSENFVRIPALLDQYGWLGADVLGLKASDGLWAVMENASGKPQLRKKYLPLLRKAVEAGTVDPERLAIMQDWVLTGDHKPQLYGTQLTKNKQGVYVPLPIANPQSVDIRRAKMGLPPMKDYLADQNDNTVVVGVVNQLAN